MLRRPGYLIEDYIKGRRYVCASPIAMLGVFAACIAFGAALLFLGWLTGRRSEERRRKRRSKA